MKSLESDGLILREVDQEDNRGLRFFLTPLGAALLSEASLAYQEFNQKRFGSLSAAEQSTLQHNLESLNAQLAALVSRRG